MGFIDTALDAWDSGGDYVYDDVSERSPLVQNGDSDTGFDGETVSPEYTPDEALSKPVDPRLLGTTACDRSNFDLFFPPETKEPEDNRKARQDAAIAVCAGCPVVAACLEYALVNEHDGPGEVAGATTFNEREVMRLLGNPPRYIIRQPKIHDKREGLIDPEAEAENRRHALVIAAVNILATGEAPTQADLVTVSGVPAYALDKLYGKELKGKARLHHILNQAYDLIESMHEPTEQ